MAAQTDRLSKATAARESLLCVGLDPDPRRIPGHLGRGNAALLAFCRAIVDATAPHVCAFKPQFAHFAATGAEDELAELIADIHARHPGIPVILDAKRGDIGSTAERYAIEAFDRYGADAVTVSPYMGGDSLAPFLERTDRTVLVLCRTSNPGAGELQDLEIDGEPLYQRVARQAAGAWNRHGNVGLVVAATRPDELRTVREIAPEVPILAPGVGAQGASPPEAVHAGRCPGGRGLLVNAARSVIYAGEGPGFADAAAEAAAQLHGRLEAALR